MAKSEKAELAVIECYRRMYREATPKANFDQLHKNYATTIPGWFMYYYLPQERQEEIMEEVLKEINVPKHLLKSFSVEVNLGCSPNTSLEQWEKKRGCKLEDWEQYEGKLMELPKM
jgi:hypothetical protein